MVVALSNHSCNTALLFDVAGDGVGWFAVELISGDVGKPRRQIRPVRVALRSRRSLIALQVLSVHCGHTYTRTR